MMITKDRNPYRRNKGEEKENRRGGQDKAERGIPEQESGEDTREYYTEKEELWFQAYAQNKRSLNETFLFFMPKEPKRERRY